MTEDGGFGRYLLLTIIPATILLLPWRGVRFLLLQRQPGSTEFPVTCLPESKV